MEDICSSSGESPRLTDTEVETLDCWLCEVLGGGVVAGLSGEEVDD